MNTPNKLSLTRILLLPVFLFIYLADFIPYGKLIGLFVFFFATFTDFLDGYIARKYNLVTDLGIFLDPIADKLLASTGLIVLVADHTIPMPFGIIFMFIMLFRDYAVTGLRQIAQLKGIIIAADKWAKIKANSLYFTLHLGILLSFFISIQDKLSAQFLDTFKIIFYVFVGITTVLIINSGVVYMVKNGHVLKQKKTDKEVIATLDRLDDRDED